MKICGCGDTYTTPGEECENCERASESTETVGYVSVNDKGKDKLAVFEAWVSNQHNNSGDPWFHVADITAVIDQIRKEI